MDRHHTNVSIAYAVISIAGGFHKTPSEYSAFAVGVLARAPGDGAMTIARDIGTAIDMEIVEVRCPTIEYHPGAINAVAYGQVKKAVATDKPVLIILDEAQGADTAVLEVLISAIAKRVENRPVAVLAITTAAGENNVAQRLANGLEWSVDRIAMHRTDQENARLLQKFVATNA